MSTGNSSTTTTTQQSAPWGPAQPYLTNLLSQAQSTYQNAQGQTAYPDTVAGFSPQTQDALNAVWQRATTGSPLVSAADQSVTGLMQPQTAPGSATLSALTNGYADPGAGLTQAGAGGNGMLNAAGMAGMNLGLNAAAGPNLSAAAVNPYLDQMFSAESQPVEDAVNAEFGLAGRTGSGAQQQEMTRDLGNLASQVYGNNYLGEQQLGLSAYNDQNQALANSGTLLSGLGENQASRQLTAGSQLSSDALNQAGLQANAANSLNSQFNTGNNLQLAAAGLAPQLASQDYTNLQNMLSVGGAYDALNQNVLNNQYNAWAYGQQQPWNILNAYGGAVTGLGALGGTSSGTSTNSQNQSLLPSLIGSGAALLPFF